MQISALWILLYLWKKSAQFQVHHIIHVKLVETLVVIVSEYRGISDQTPPSEEDLFKPIPYGILTGVCCLWILVSEECEFTHDAENEREKTKKFVDYRNPFILQFSLSTIPCQD